MLLVLFPSTRPAYGLADQISQRWRTRHRGSHLHQGGISFDNLGNESSPSPAAPPSIKRTMTRGGGALRDAITVDELPSLPKSASTIGEDDETPAFRSVIYVEATDAARVALPPVAASLLILSNNALQLATAAVWSVHRYPAVVKQHSIVSPDMLSGYALSVFAIAALLRVLIPFDFALTSIIDDIIVAHEVTHGAQHGFSYFALAMRLVLWIFAATSCYKLLGMELGSSVLTAWGFVGFGLTLSLQSTAKDLFSTVQLFMTRPYAIGELVDAGQGHFGFVVEVGWRFTTMQLLSSNQHIAIPNVALADARIQNYSRMTRRRGMIDLRVAHDTPVKLLRQIPTWIETCAIDAGLEVVWCFCVGITDHGVHYQSVVKGPPDSISFDTLKQTALFALLDLCAEHTVRLSYGGSGVALAPVRSSATPASARHVGAPTSQEGEASPRLLAGKMKRVVTIDEDAALSQSTVGGSGAAGDGDGEGGDSLEEPLSIDERDATVRRRSQSLASPRRSMWNSRRSVSRMLA